MYIVVKICIVLNRSKPVGGHLVRSFVRSVILPTVCACDDFHNDRSNFTGFGCNETEQRWPPAAVAFRDRLESQQAMTFTPGLNPEQVKPRELYMYHKA